MFTDTEELKRLEDELFDAWLAIRRQAPEQFRSLLASYSTTGWDPFVWRDEVVRGVIAAAPAGIDRVMCPLCRSGSMVSVGFTLPTGLRRHLVGQGTTQQCDVVFAATRLARDYWIRKAREQRELAAEAAAKPQRRLRPSRRKQLVTVARVPSKPVVVLVRRPAANSHTFHFSSVPGKTIRAPRQR